VLFAAQSVWGALSIAFEAAHPGYDEDATALTGVINTAFAAGANAVTAHVTVAASTAKLSLFTSYSYR
jgi:hypothetical protein